MCLLWGLCVAAPVVDVDVVGMVFDVVGMAVSCGGCYGWYFIERCVGWLVVRLVVALA